MKLSSSSAKRSIYKLFTCNCIVFFFLFFFLRAQKNDKITRKRGRFSMENLLKCNQNLREYIVNYFLSNIQRKYNIGSFKKRIQFLINEQQQLNSSRDYKKSTFSFSNNIFLIINNIKIVFSLFSFKLCKCSNWAFRNTLFSEKRFGSFECCRNGLAGILWQIAYYIMKVFLVD